MNLRDRTRRPALVLGLVCATLGGLGSFAKLKPIFRHYKFEALVGSEAVKREGQWYTEDVQRERSIYFEKKAELQAKMPLSSTKRNFHTLPEPQDLALRIQFLSIQTSDELFRIQQIHSDLNTNGIRRIRWTDDYGLKSIDNSTPWPRRLEVEVIETQGGEILVPTPSPPTREYLLIAVLPVFGFLVGCAAIRPFALVAASFFQRSDREQTQSGD